LFFGVAGNLGEGAINGEDAPLRVGDDDAFGGVLEDGARLYLAFLRGALLGEVAPGHE
jgi:hypothetical protein